MENVFIKPEQRDILLVPFPFSDLSGNKVRPVLVVSKDEFNKYSGDVIVCGITSNITKDSYSVKINNKNLDEGHLTVDCCIKIENILKVDKKLLIKKIGKLRKQDFHGVLDKLNSLFR